MKELLGSETCELERENLKLKSQLRTVRAELDQANSSLRTLEGADGHGTVQTRTEMPYFK